MMKHPWIWWGLFLASFPLLAQDPLEDPPQPPRSPEGQQALEFLQKKLIRAFQSSQIEKKYLAAQRLAQLIPNEINREILVAAIESLKVSNVNYQWYLSHLLKKISGEDHQINLEAWRDWLRNRYQPVTRPIGSGSLTAEGPQEGSGHLNEGSGSSLPAVEGSHHRPSTIMTPGQHSRGHENSGGVRPEDVVPDGRLGHDPLDHVVPPPQTNQMDLSDPIHHEGSGSFKGPGVEKLPPKKEDISQKSKDLMKVETTSPSEEMIQEFLIEPDKKLPIENSFNPSEVN